jgi:hypothetical protein
MGEDFRPASRAADLADDLFAARFARDDDNPGFNRFGDKVFDIGFVDLVGCPGQTAFDCRDGAVKFQ